MKLPDFEEARAIASQRSYFEQQLRKVKKNGIDQVHFPERGYEQDPQILDFLAHALTAHYKEKIASIDRALIALGVEL